MDLCLVVVFRLRVAGLFCGFAAFEVVEFEWAYETGGASMMVRPLASDGERTERSDVHEVDNRKSSLEARQLRADDAQ